ncbi:MAG: hypothetical protein PHP22_08615 [Oscillospiraceae bacterium]|nr:hypothetical protein [Oscillospiraceae bacterium]
MQRELYYKPSGKANPLGLLGLLLITVIAGSAISIPYLFFVRVIPFAKLSVLLTLVFGGVMGALGGLACTLFKIRNRALALTVSAIGILIYTYFKWAAYVSYVFEESYTYILTELMLDPIDMVAKIIRINEEGTWSLGADGNAVTGIFLAIVWILEFLIYAIIHLIVVNDKSNDPFIEKDDRWAKKLDAKFFFRDFNVESSRASIESDPGFLFDHLEEAQNIGNTGHVEAELFHSQDFTENYLDITRMVITNPAKNNVQAKKVISKLAVSRAFVQQLLEKNGMSFPA